MMKILFALTFVFAPSFLLVAQNTEHVIPMVEESWEAASGRIEFVTHRGTPAMKITASPEALFAEPGQVVLKDFQFDEGTIEFDVELTDFFLSAIYFRLQDSENAEVFYLRTYRANDPTGPDAVQYTELTQGVALWDLHPRYQGSATFHKNEWNHIKLVISGQRLYAYVNDMAKPAITIPELMGNLGPGSIAFEGGGIIANLVVKPGVTEGLPRKAAYDPTKDDPYYIHTWQVSESLLLPPGQELVSAMLFRAYSDYFPNDSTEWKSINSEREGLVNLSRRFGRSEERRAVWLKKIIHSNVKQSRTLNLGFSDEVWVLLNDKLVYVDKNLYSHPIMKDAYGQISINDASFQLPLEEGENELLIGVANSFFGWAIMARLENIDALTMQ